MFKHSWLRAILVALAAFLIVITPTAVEGATAKPAASPVCHGKKCPSPTPTPTTSTPTPTTTSPSPSPTEIPADCSVDVTSQLNSLFANAADFSTVTLAANGCYRTEGEVRLDGVDHLTIDGNGATLKRTVPTPLELQYPQENEHLGLWGAKDVLVKNLKIQGLNVTSDNSDPEQGAYIQQYEFEHGVRVYSGDGVTLDNININGVYGDGVAVGQYAQNVTVQNTYIAKNGRQGISLTSGGAVKFLNNTIYDSRRSGFDLEPNGSDDTVTGVEIAGGRIRSRLLAITSGGDGIVSNVNIHDVDIWSSGVPVINIDPAHDLTGVRTNWTVDRVFTELELGSTLPLISLGQCRDIALRNLTMPAQSGRNMTAVGMTGCGGTVEITNSNFLPGATTLYTNTSPQADLQVVASGNSPS